MGMVTLVPVCPYVANFCSGDKQCAAQGAPAVRETLANRTNPRYTPT